MSGTTLAGTQYATTGDPAEIHTVSQNLANSILPTLVPSFATTTARDAAYGSPPTGAPLCWIVNRAGHCYYDTLHLKWQWVSVHNKVGGGIRASAADTDEQAPGVPIVLLPDYVLPPGNRLIQIIASSVVTNISSPAVIVQPRAYITSLSDGDNYMQASLPATTCQASVSRTWMEVRNGTISFDMYGLTAGSPAAAVRFTNSWLQIYDLGATDE